MSDPGFHRDLSGAFRELGAEIESLPDADDDGIRTILARLAETAIALIIDDTINNWTGGDPFTDPDVLDEFVALIAENLVKAGLKL